MMRPVTGRLVTYRQFDRARHRPWCLLRVGRLHRAGNPMSYFAVTREAGPGWLDGKGAFGQPCAGDHAAFMNTLAEEGLVLLAGPLAGCEQSRIRSC